MSAAAYGEKWQIHNVYYANRHTINDNQCSRIIRSRHMKYGIR